MPGMVLSASFDMAISAPVLPPDSAASARCSLTALMAMPIEVVRARRIAWLGFSLEVIASAEWTIAALPPSAPCLPIISSTWRSSP